MKNIKSIISNASIASKQKKLLIIAVSIGALLLMIIFNYVGSDTKKKTKEKTSAKVVTALDSIETSDFWLHKSESRLDNQDQAIKDLQAEIDRIQRHSTKEGDGLQTDSEVESRLLQLEEMIAGMAVSNQTSSLPASGGSTMPSRINRSMHETYEDVEVYNMQEEFEPPILSLSMGLKNAEVANSGALTVNTFIPVGSFVKAVLLTGVDAPAGTTSADNPVPMLLRIVDDAVLPRGMRGKIDTCHVTASAYGEISEERVRVRLDKISCTYLDGRVFVENFDGYVAGEDGKSGIRGKVIWREGALITRSFAAGFLGGVSQGIGDSAGVISTSPLGAVETFPGSQLFQAGVGTGAGSALNKLSEYYIKRAEQYHPVIEVEAGRVVDIVVTTRKDSKSNGLNLGNYGEEQ